MVTTTVSSNWLIWKASDLSDWRGEGGTIEDQLILAAQHIGIEDRQPAFDHLANDHLLAHIDLAAIIGRAVRDEPDLRPALGQRLADPELAPDVLADRDAEADAAEVATGPGVVGAGLEHALLVELAIVRQVDLETLGDDLSGIGDDDRIVHARFALQRRADDDGRSAIGGVGGNVLRRRLAGCQNAGRTDQILGRIAGDEQFGEQHQVGAVACSISPRLACLGEVAGNVADDRVKLRNRDAENVWSGFLAMPCDVACGGVGSRAMAQPRGLLFAHGWSLRESNLHPLRRRRGEACHSGVAIRRGFAGRSGMRRHGRPRRPFAH